MVLNITLDGNSIVEENFLKNTDVKIAQQSLENDGEFSSPEFDLKLTYEAGQLLLF